MEVKCNERKIFTPGIYDISNEEYHASAGISRSAIMEFKKTPKHYWHKYINPNHIKSIETPQMAFGSAIHSYILEPEKFKADYFISEKNPFHGNSTEGKKFKVESLIKSGTKKVIDPEDFMKIKAIKESLFSDKNASELVIGAEYEKSIFWIDSDTGLLCKCRPDILHANFVVDLKTTVDASERAFQRSFYSYGYPLQMAMISEGLKATTGASITNFIDLALEKEEPYASAIYAIDEAALQHGVSELKHYLAKMKECFDQNEWPGYPTKTLCLPNYATIGE